VKLILGLKKAVSRIYRVAQRFPFAVIKRGSQTDSLLFRAKIPYVLFLLVTGPRQPLALDLSWPVILTQLA